MLKHQAQNRPRPQGAGNEATPPAVASKNAVVLVAVVVVVVVGGGCTVAGTVAVCGSAVLKLELTLNPKPLNP